MLSIFGKCQWNRFLINLLTLYCLLPPLIAVLEQLPWYQELLNRGRKQDLIKGIASGDKFIYRIARN